MDIKPLRITILHTNDMHASLEAMSRLSTFAKRLRRELESEGRLVFFFDAGDSADRRIRFIGVTKGLVYPPVIEAMGYDAQTLGNSISITYGPPAAAVMAQRASYSVMAANFFDQGRPMLEGFQAVCAFPVPNGLRLGVVGLTTHSPDTYDLFNMRLPDYRDSARYWFAELVRKGRGPIVALTHLGSREDLSLAEAGIGFDVIIGGHSHHLLPAGEIVNGVLRAQAGEYAEHLGRIDLLVDADSGAVLEKTAVVIPIPADTPADPLVNAAIRRAEEEAQALMQKPIAELSESLDQSYFAECALADLAADVLRERMQAELAILTSGLFNHDLPAGTLTLGALDGACFTTANPQLSLLPGEQILAGLERGLDPVFMEQRLKVFRGAPVGMPVISGMTIEYTADPDGRPRITHALVQGQPLEPQRVYRVAHTDAEVKVGNNDFGYFALKPGQLVRAEVPTILREAIEDYLRANSPVARPAGGRWIVR